MMKKGFMKMTSENLMMIEETMEDVKKQIKAIEPYIVSSNINVVLMVADDETCQVSGCFSPEDGITMGIDLVFNSIRELIDNGENVEALKKSLPFLIQEGLELFC